EMQKTQRLWRFGSGIPTYGYRDLNDALYYAESATLCLIEAAETSEGKYGKVRFRRCTSRYLPVKEILLEFGRELQERVGLDEIDDVDLEMAANRGEHINGVHAEVWRDLRGDGHRARDLPRAISEVMGNADTIWDSEQFDELLADLEDRLMEAFEMAEEEWV